MGINFNTHDVWACLAEVKGSSAMMWVLFLIPVMCWDVAIGEIKLLNDVRGVVVGCSLVGRVFVCSVLSNSNKNLRMGNPYGGLIIRWQKPR